MKISNCLWSKLIHIYLLFLRYTLFMFIIYCKCDIFGNHFKIGFHISQYHSSFKPTWVFLFAFFCLSSDICNINKQNRCWYLGPAAKTGSKDRKYSRHKTNISNSKINRGCPPLTTNRTSADCVENTPGTPVQHIPLRVHHNGGSTLWFHVKV